VYLSCASKRITQQQPQQQQQQQRAQHRPLQRTMMSMRACLPRAAATPSPEFTLSYTLRMSA
jgi:transcription initiation factor TFIID subunit TAF12